MLPNKIPDTIMEKLAEGHEEIPQAYRGSLSIVEIKTDFIECFRKTFSVNRSLKVVDLKRHILDHWKTSDYLFALNYNDVVSSWADDIMASAATRARGYVMEDEDTESGLVEDASGAVKYFDADSSLTKMFLKAMYPDEFSEKTQQRVVDKDGEDVISLFASAIMAVHGGADNDSGGD